MTGLPGAMIMNCPGVFFTPVSSCFGVPKAEFTLYFSIINITAMVHLPLCGKIMDRANLRYFMSVAVLLAGVTYILISKALSKSTRGTDMREYLHVLDY